PRRRERPARTGANATAYVGSGRLWDSLAAAQVDLKRRRDVGAGEPEEQRARPDVLLGGGLRELSWERVDVPPLPAEPGDPLRAGEQPAGRQPVLRPPTTGDDRLHRHRKQRRLGHRLGER